MIELRVLEDAVGVMLKEHQIEPFLGELFFWQDIASQLTKYANLGFEQESQQDVAWTMTALRLIQIACATTSDCQALALASRIHEPVIKIVAKHLTADHDKLAWRSMAVLSNMVTRNAAVAEVLYPIVLKALPLQQTLQNGNTLEPSLVFLRNSVYADKTFLNLLSKDGPLLVSLLSTSEEGGLLGQQGAGQLVSAIIEELMQNDCLESVIHSLYQEVDSTRVEIRYLWELIRDLCSQETLPQRLDVKVPLTIVAMLYQSLAELGNLQENNPTQNDLILWQILACQAAALSSILSNEQQQNLLKDQAIQASVTPVVELLGIAHLRFPRTTGGRMKNVDETVVVRNLKRDCIAIIMNLSYGNKEIQDLVRTTGGLALVLAQCNIDESNPYIKEWATVCMRVLLEGNLENQAQVENMTPIGTQQTPELDELGLQSYLTPDGKVELRQLANDQGVQATITSINDSYED
ncbi:spinocerebellar ataxia type 10 protein domain-domain-containing protein [Protomyces lactucae-debilis]|uniref:Ataxin-10 homolog n=1 Tax=Protomyces lactucae-debilis TaxID=2754530 RepID=A0A1Y2FW18_PROLT|nr:spinocerebellar ataxia type 10 protein domain-containing protein [Protomyces lactucae-debilis]ORY87737.1 spinocerebellar ataxia type 10 protein domain-domain-containing protein [Protomyces lactucae-debilis]